MRCRAIGERSNQWCERRAIRGERYCPSHKRSRVRKPSLPPSERTSALQLVDEVMRCDEPEEKPAPAKRSVSKEEFDADPDGYIVICRGLPTESIVPRCQAKSKRSGKRCRNPSCRGKSVCRFHGGKSTGARTEAGKVKQGAHFFRHGRETIAIRKRRARMHRELRIMERVIKEHGI